MTEAILQKIPSFVISNNDNQEKMQNIMIEKIYLLLWTNREVKIKSKQI